MQPDLPRRQRQPRDDGAASYLSAMGFLSGISDPSERGGEPTGRVEAGHRACIDVCNIVTITETRQRTFRPGPGRAPLLFPRRACTDAVSGILADLSHARPEATHPHMLVDTGLRGIPRYTDVQWIGAGLRTQAHHSRCDELRGCGPSGDLTLLVFRLPMSRMGSSTEPAAARPEQLIGALVTPATRRSARPVPLDMPALPRLRLPADAGSEPFLIDVARLDASGRFCSRSLLAALAWPPGQVR